MKVSILGAGELGATIAQKLAAGDWAGELLLHDTAASTAQGKALDLMQANPVLLSGTRIRGTSSPEELSGSWCVVVADYGGSGDGSPGPDQAEKIFANLERHAGESVVLLAGRDPSSLLHLGADRQTVPRHRILATFPVALASAWRINIGQEVGCSPQDVQVSLLGLPPRKGYYEVFAGVAGRSWESLLTPAQAREVARRTERPPGPRSLATAAVNVIRSMVRKASPVQSCYVWVEQSYGARRRFLCAPSLLGLEGLERVLEFPLDPKQRVTLERCLGAKPSA